MDFEKPRINLFIVGAAKSGTTSLYNYLNQHPDIFFPSVKEPHFYSNVESQNPDAYSNPKKGKQYHSRVIRDSKQYYSLYQESESYKIVCDSSPSYLWDESSAERIYNDFPDSRILIILRDPVDRAYSHFLMDIKLGNQSEDNFYQALINDKKSISRVWGKVHLYEDLGMYYEQVKKYLNRFNNVKIIIYEEFIKDTKKTLLEVFDFLEINKEEINRINYQTVFNSYSIPKNRIVKYLMFKGRKTNLLKTLIPDSLRKMFNNKFRFKEGIKPKISEDAELYLTEVFKEDILKLEVLLKRDLKIWKHHN